MVAYRQLSTRASSQQCAKGTPKYTWSKVWPWILIWAYLIWNFAPIFGQQISILDPLTLDFLVRLGLNFNPMGEFGGVGVDWASDIFCHGQKHDYYLSRASQRGATKNLDNSSIKGQGPTNRV